MATSPYPQLGNYDWGQLLALSAIHRQCAPTLRVFASLLPGAANLRNLLSNMVSHAGVAAQGATGGEVVEAMVDLTSATTNSLIAHPGTTPPERPVLEAISGHLSLGGIATGDPFHELYSSCEDACAQLYGDAWSDPGPFELRSAEDHPRGLDDPYAVDGKTAPPSQGRRVLLRVSTTRLGPEAYAILPRVFLHELICHVGAGDGEDPDPLSPFAEGLMDWASLHYLEAWAPVVCDGFSNAAVMHAQASAGSFKADSSTKAARETGQDAALMLVHQRGSPPEIARLAIDLNAAARSREFKNEFVRRVLGGRLDATSGPLSDVLDGRTSVEELLDSL